MRAFAFLALAGVVTAAVAAQRIVFTDAEKDISKRMGGLRAMRDSDRAVETKSLALQIRQLPAGNNKRLLAYGLANEATEGDFGRDTLQAVTTTLEESIRETPPAPTERTPVPDEYLELAQLARFEHMKVHLQSPSYTAALTELDGIIRDQGEATFTLSDIAGKPWTLGDLKGKVVLVNFWATWCPPCRKEMPDLETLYNRFKDKGFVILAISDEKLDTVQKFIDKNGYTYPILLDLGRKINDAYHVGGIPKSFIYNRQGKLVAQAMDMRTQGQFLALLGQAGLK